MFLRGLSCAMDNKTFFLANNEKGYALPMVMAVSMIIVLITMAIVSSVRQKLATAIELQNRNVAYLKAYSATSEVLYYFSSSPLNSLDLEVRLSDGGPTRWNLYGEPIRLSQGVSFTLRDLSGMISPVLQPNFFRKLVEYVLHDSEKTNALMDSFLDWQDADDLKRLNGAERWDYSAAGYSYAPRNFYIQVSEELLLVKGFDPETFEKIRQDIAYWNVGFINYLTMSEQTLSAFLQNDSLVKRILELRRKGELTWQIFSQLTGVQPTEDLVTFASGYIKFVLTAQEQTSVSTIEASVAKIETQSAPLTILEWKS